MRGYADCTRNKDSSKSMSTNFRDWTDRSSKRTIPCDNCGVNNRARAAALVLAAVGIVHAQSASKAPGAVRKETVMSTHATGTFDVKLTPQVTDTEGEGSPLGRFSIAKQFHGDLEGTSKGEMLTAGTSIKESAGYVAIERV